MPVVEVLLAALVATDGMTIRPTRVTTVMAAQVDDRHGPAAAALP